MRVSAQALHRILNGRTIWRREARHETSDGVWFDLGHGLGSFNFAAARKCLDAGFLCDTISTDIYNLNVKGPVYDMTTTMWKLPHLGMSFPDIVLRSTATPARIVNRWPAAQPISRYSHSKTAASSIPNSIPKSPSAVSSAAWPFAGAAR